MMASSTCSTPIAGSRRCRRPSRCSAAARAESPPLFSERPRLTGTDNQAQLRATINAAARSNVTVNPIDARGLVATAPLGDGLARVSEWRRVVSRPDGDVDDDRVSAVAGHAYALAKDTGGKVLLDYNDLSAGIVQAAKAVTSYYIVGVLQLYTATDGRFRRIKVTLNGNPSAEIAYRPGIYADKSELHWRRQGAPARRGAREPDHRSDHRDGSELLPAESGRALRAGGGEDPRERAGDCAPPRLRAPRSTSSASSRTSTAIQCRTSAIGCRSLSPRTRPTSSRRGPSSMTPGSRFCRANTSSRYFTRDAETGRIGTYQGDFTIPNLNVKRRPAFRSAQWS